MLNFVWPIFIIISIVYGVLFGDIEKINNSIFTTLDSTMTIIISLTATMCFWSGIMNIIKETSLINKIERLLKPLIKKIFTNLNEKDEEYKYISMNMVSNILGLGNASTPLGLKAMEEMDKKRKNKNKLSKNMMMFILINTASIQIIPTTVIGIRSALGSSKPSAIIIPVWIVSILAFISVITIGKIVFKGEK